MHPKGTRDRLPNLNPCPIVNDDGDACGQPSDRNAPFPICERHLVRAYRYVSSQVGSLADDPLFQFKYNVDRLQEKYDREHRAMAGRKLVVYYVQIGPHIKIGYTANLKQRLAAYPASRRVLALEEVDSPTVEEQRHRQFRHLLDMGREWFRPGPDLIAHINDLRAEQGAKPLRFAA